MLDSVKQEKKAEFVVDWNVDNYYAEYKDKDIKKDDLSNSMKESLINDGTYISNLPVKGWKKSLLDKPKLNNISNNTEINNNNIVLPNQEINILPGNHVKVTGFDIGKIIIRDRSNKGNKEDAVSIVSIKNEFKDEIINRNNIEKIFISPENLKDSNLNESVKMSGSLFSTVMEYDNINIFPNIVFELDHIREMLAFLPLIIGVIVFVLYKLKNILFNYDYIFFFYVKFVGIKNKFINSKFIGIIKKNYYKLFSVIPVIPTSQSESLTQNVDNNNINIVNQKMNKIVNDLQDIIDGVLLQKGGLDNKDVDGLKKILNYKMEKAEIDPNRFFANVNIIKESNDINLSEEDKARLSERLFSKTSDMLQRVASMYGNTPKTLEEHKKIIDNANQRSKDLGLEKRIEVEYSNDIKNQTESNTNSNISDNITPNNNQSLNTIEESLNFFVLQNENYYTFNLKYLDLIELLNFNTDFLSYILFCFIGIIIVFYLLKKKIV